MSNSQRNAIQRLWQRPEAKICLGLVVIACAVFGPTLRDSFINFDDDVYVYNNPIVARGITASGVAWAFTNFHAANWHPVTWLSHMADCQIYGMNPAGHHLTSLLLHTATVVVLFLFLRGLTGAMWRSAFVAAAFAVHPLRAESVAWVAERKDVLSGLFFVLTLSAYAGFVPRRDKRFYLLSLFLFALGLMSKPMLVTVPVVLLLLDFWPLHRREAIGKLALEKAPFLVLSFASCAITVLAQRGPLQSTASIALPTRLANALVTYAVYLGQMIWPSGLAFFYPYPLQGVPAWEWALAGVLIAGVSIFTIIWRRNQPWLLMGWIWYLVMLLPVVGIIQVGGQAHADRYTYLPQIGISIAVAWLAAEWLKPTHAAFAAGAVLMALMVCAWQQVGYWKDSETLWLRTLDCTTNNATARFGLGLAFHEQGDAEDAVAQFQKALQIEPDYWKARYNLGIDLMRQGRVDEAIVAFQQVVHTRPGYAAAENNLGFALMGKGRLNEAIGCFQEALKSNPTMTMARRNLGEAYYKSGKVNEAIRQYQQALQLEPDNADIQQLLNQAELRGAVPRGR